MSRLPTPGSDDGTWGDILNDFLEVEHNADGTLKSSGSLAGKANDNAVVHLAGSETVTGAKNFTGGLNKNGNSVVDTSQLGAASGVATLNSSSQLTAAQIPSTVLTATGASVPPATAGGTKLVNVPTWQAATAYPSGFVIQQGGVLYASTTAFSSGASFGADGSNWTPMSSAELAYAQITSPFSTTSTTAVNVTGLSLTVTTNGRPFMVRFVGTVQNSLANGFANLMMTRTTDSTQVALQAIGIGAANEAWPGYLECRQALSAGTYSYQLLVSSFSASNTVKIGPSASTTSPVFVQAIQI